jgi:hypothetical protein
MRAAGLEPLVDYPGSHERWACRCQQCGRTVTPRYRHVADGVSGGCRYCGDKGGFNPGKPAIVYLIWHRGFDAYKIGVGREGGNRIDHHRRSGWQLIRKFPVRGDLALTVERAVLDWWRNDLNLPAHVAKTDMPLGGWTETVDSQEIDMSVTIQRIESLIAANAVGTIPEVPTALAND